MKLLHAVAATLLSTTASHVAVAQHIVPAGVVATRRVASAHDPHLRAIVPRAIPSDSAHGHPWRWIGAGVLLGAVAGGVAGGVSVAHNDDAFLAGPAIGLSAAAGGIVGGLIGGLSYAISHGAGADPHDKDLARPDGERGHCPD